MLFQNESGMATIDDIRGKYIFWDIDGTLAPFRFNDHISDPLGTHHGMSLVEIDEGIFFSRKPSKHMMNVVKTCEAKKQIILGHCHAQKEIDDKNKWIPKYFPQISEIILVPDEVEKYEVILDYCEKNDILPADCVFVDDKIPLLQAAEKQGIKAYHISSFLDFGL